MQNQTTMVSDYKHIVWENPNPPPPCGKECPFYELWEEQDG
jgi:hypothetical protein